MTSDTKTYWKRLNLEATRRMFETQLAAVKARRRHDGGNAVTSETIEAGGSTTWQQSTPQFQAAADCNDWTYREMTHLLSALQGQATDVMLCPSGKGVWDVVGAMKGREGITS